jgi:hypothetical protein
MGTLSGCGTCTDLGTRPGTYTIKVIGTPSGTGANPSPGGGASARVTMKVAVI